MIIEWCILGRFAKHPRSLFRNFVYLDVSFRNQIVIHIYIVVLDGCQHRPIFVWNVLNYIWSACRGCNWRRGGPCISFIYCIYLNAWCVHHRFCSICFWHRDWLFLLFCLLMGPFSNFLKIKFGNGIHIFLRCNSIKVIWCGRYCFKADLPKIYVSIGIP